MYQLKLASAKTLVVSGAPVNVAEPITLNPGWNWIGYKPQMPLNINTALVSPHLLLEVTLFRLQVLAGIIMRVMVGMVNKKICFLGVVIKLKLRIVEQLPIRNLFL